MQSFIWHICFLLPASNVFLVLLMSFPLMHPIRCTFHLLHLFNF
uniref:Uncharacterized protein n=1 Tax=Rhizophora mucronata TaxID=61149 RepID=A0A2P2N117_RHIMU